MPSRRKLSRELRLINKKYMVEIEPVKNIRRASQILSKGCYATSIIEIEKIMICYIEELGLGGVARHFNHVISVFENGKTRSVLRKLRIYLMVGVFLEESLLFGEKPSVVVQLFHILMIEIMREMEFTMDELIIFEDRIEKTGTESYTSIEDLLKYLHSLDYEGRWWEAANLDGQNEMLAEKIASMSIEASVDEEMNLEAVLRKQEEEEELTREAWRRISKLEVERRLSRGRRGRRGGSSWTHGGRRGRRGGGSWTHRGGRGRQGGGWKRK